MRFLCFLVLLSNSVFAQIQKDSLILQQESNTQAQSLKALSRELTDPTALIWQIQFEDYLRINNYEGGVGNTFRTRIVIPIRPPNGIGQQIRLNQNLELRNGVWGWGDFQIFDILIPSRKAWGAWGIGPLINIPTASHGLGSGQLSLGFAAAVSINKDTWGPWQLDVLFEYYKSIAGDPNRPEVQQAYIQPSLTYHLSKGFYFETEPVLTFDIEGGFWIVPLDLRLGKVFKGSKFKYNTYIEPEYTWSGNQSGTKFGVRFGYRIII